MTAEGIKQAIYSADPAMSFSEHSNRRDKLPSVDAAEGIENKAENVPYILRHSHHIWRSDVFVKRLGMTLLKSRASVPKKSLHIRLTAGDR